MTRNRYAKTALSLTAACAGIYLLASVGSAQAYESAMDACRKWTGEGAGMQYKCFDCVKRVGDEWINTCPEYSSSWAWVWVPNR